MALAYRLITVLIAALGVFYYFGNRREMAEVMHEAEQEKPAIEAASRRTLRPHSTRDRAAASR